MFFRFPVINLISSRVIIDQVMQVMQSIQVMQKGTGGPKKRMNFRKSSKRAGGGGVIFHAKIYSADFGPFNWAF